VLTVHQSLGRGVARINEMDLRQQLLLSQRFMHLWKDLLIGSGGMGCLDMGDQVRALFVTGLG
jgi:hypothetical protein